MLGGSEARQASEGVESTRCPVGDAQSRGKAGQVDWSW
jgi:hypothetical protein